MNKILIAKDVVYASKTGGGLIAGYNDVNLLVDGALAFLNEHGLLVTSANAATTLADSKYVTAVVGRAKDTLIVPIIPRRDVTNVNLVPYRACTKIVRRIGGNSVSTTLPFTTTGEASVFVKDVTESSKNLSRTVRATVYKKASMTEEQMVDAMVVALNAGNSFIVASKVGSGVNLGINITTKEDDTLISVVVTDMWAGCLQTVVTPFVHSIGKGVDILQMEKDFSVEEGNGNYIDYGAEYYTRAMQAIGSSAYDVITLEWEGRHSSPTRSHNVMRNAVSIACVDGAAEQEAAEIMALITVIIGQAYAPLTGAETGLDTGTKEDGVAGN